tara:strand:+ start:47 stop:256 length:210 start_codon:yes stop_codon:yes gene_type:complete
MDIVERLRSPEVFIMDGPMISPVAFEAADEIERLREALLDAVGFVSRADSLFLRKATTDTLKGIPDGYR